MPTKAAEPEGPTPAENNNIASSITIAASSIVKPVAYKLPEPSQLAAWQIEAAHINSDKNQNNLLVCGHPCKNKCGESCLYLRC